MSCGSPIPSQLIEMCQNFFKDQITIDSTFCLELDDCIFAFIIYMISKYLDVFVNLCKYGHIPTDLCSETFITISTNKLFSFRCNFKTILERSGFEIIGKKMYGVKCNFPKIPKTVKISSNIFETTIFLDIDLEAKKE